MQENTVINKERAVLAGISCKLKDFDNADDQSLAELEALLETAGGEAFATVFQKRDTPDPRTLIGGGKAEEIKALVDAEKLDLVVFDNELSPAQTRNLEKDIGARVIDRSILILDIFADRAKTHEGRVQVEMAQLKYTLPRLTGKGASLSRQGGSSQPIGTRGPGETQLETDRRHIHRRLEKLKAELADIQKNRDLLRGRRRKTEQITVSLIGYTNAGKSTLFNRLTKSAIPANNRLFDTLDTTARNWYIDGKNVILTDTVGFIKKLPHHLIEAFKSTLDELRQADLLLHVVDASNPEMDAQIQTVETLAAEICGEGGAPILRVYNKCDLVPGMGEKIPGLKISAKTGGGIDELKARVTEYVLSEN